MDQLGDENGRGRARDNGDGVKGNKMRLLGGSV